MYVYKMAFLEKEAIKKEVFEYLKEKGIIIYTDYGIIELQNNLAFEEKEFWYCRANLPNEIFEALADDEIDFVQLV